MATKPTAAYALQSAITRVTEYKFDLADRAFNAVLHKALLGGVHIIEARAHRLMAMYQTDDKTALQHLDLAESAIGHYKNTVQSDREEERAQILRLRAARALHAGNEQAAWQAVHQLEEMANGSHNTVIQQSYHAALGALMMS